MATCPACHRPVTRVTYGAGPDQQTLLLEPGGTVATYVSVEMASIYPEDGDRVFLSNATILHEQVCPTRWRQTLQQMARNAAAKHEKASQKGGRTWKHRVPQTLWPR